MVTIMDNPKIFNTLKKGVLNNIPYTLKPIECRIKLNQNESPFDIPEFLKKKIISRLDKSSWNIYPDFIPDDLYTKVSGYFKFDKSSILIGNGSNEMIFTILASTLESGKKFIMPSPTFDVYRLISSNLNADIKRVSLNKDYSFNVNQLAEESKTRGSVTVICSPNNPTGTIMKRDDIETIINSSQGLVVVDEAYIHFGGESAIDLVNKYPNLVVLRTFSKAFGLAGLRVGMMISNKDLINEFSKVKLPYNLNIFTMITLDEIFDNMDIVTENIKNILKEKEFLLNELFKIKQLEVTPSGANFFLVKSENSQFLFNELLKYDILVRDYSNYPMLENQLRISVGSHNDNISLINALTEIYSKKGLTQ
jgi:histidinol-phosphate aminotransferase